MDINDFMKKNLELLERIAEGIESLNDQGIAVTNIALPVGTELLAVGDVIKASPAETAKPAAKTAKPATTKPAAKKPTVDEEAVAEIQAEEAEAAKPAAKAKRATVDDARKALKAYAATEGNEAAMELLTGLGAASVSALEESSTDEDDKLAQLIQKCGE